MIFIPCLVDLLGTANYTVLMSQKRIQELKEEIADLKKRLPAHSIPASMLMALDELEEMLAKELKREAEGLSDA